MLNVFMYTPRKQPETHMECARLDCSKCVYGDTEDAVTCQHRRAMWEAERREDDKKKAEERYAAAISSIIMIGMAFDYSIKHDGEAVLRQIRKIANKELIIHR